MKTKTIQQTVRFKAAPQAVYELLMNSKKHSLLSGEKAVISTKVPGKFTAWNGHITGFNLALKPGAKIVQAWRATGWWPDHYSVAIFDIQKSKNGSVPVSRKSACRRTDTAAITAVGSRRTGRP